MATIVTEPASRLERLPAWWLWPRTPPQFLASFLLAQVFGGVSMAIVI
jgi:hypothetical protein